MTKLTVRIRTHHFVITDFTPATRERIKPFMRSYVEIDKKYDVPTRRYVTVVKSKYYVVNATFNEYRAHINSLAEFKAYLKDVGFKDDEILYVTDPLYTPKGAEFDLNDEYQDRENQLEALKYIRVPCGNCTHLISLATGVGKSYVSMRGMEHYGVRVAVIVEAKYVVKWYEDLVRTLNIDPTRIMIVTGGDANTRLVARASASGQDQIRGLIQLGLDDAITDVDIVIISSSLMSGFIKAYLEAPTPEDFEALGYGCDPDALMKTIGVGYRLIDEVHSNFNAHYKLDLFTHVPQAVSLTATLMSDNAFVRRMHQIAYPKSTRLAEQPPKKYIEGTAWMYRMKDSRNFKCTNYFNNSYDHVKFEKSIMRNGKMLPEYAKMLRDNVDRMFLEDGFYKSDDRCLIFTRTVLMAEYFQKCLEKWYPNHLAYLYVGTKTKDKLQKVFDSDFTVSTLESAGTALDIKGLTNVIMTTMRKSSPSNIQGAGRLRELKDGRNPRFTWWVCEDIAKHMSYNNEKMALLKDRTKSTRKLYTPYVF